MSYFIDMLIEICSFTRNPGSLFLSDFYVQVGGDLLSSTPQIRCHASDSVIKSHLEHT